MTFERFQSALADACLQAINGGRPLGYWCRCPLGTQTPYPLPTHKDAALVWNISPDQAYAFINGWGLYPCTQRYHRGHAQWMELGRLYRERWG